MKFALTGGYIKLLGYVHAYIHTFTVITFAMYVDDAFVRIYKFHLGHLFRSSLSQGIGVEKGLFLWLLVHLSILT